MPNYRMRYSRRYFTHLDLPPGAGDLTVTITKVETGQLKNAKGEVEEKPFLWFEGNGKPFGCNTMNGLVIAAQLGEDDTYWPGKKVTLYRDKTMYEGRMVDCVRVRPAAAASTPAPEAPKPRRAKKAA